MRGDAVSILIVEDLDLPSFGSFNASHAYYSFRVLRGIFYVTVVVWVLMWIKLLRDNFF
ncbi:protein UL2 [Panine betaherpesvirus 2]|uniref:Protein UL2 n=1 Tax=Panine betaherpesvirus 2 TaxID=188763 RepID=Q8QS83_9BETA|nr:protein UL2 [Panine betaherpesvirus 2]AAM00654.1 protein UL2 [Panine betaherpesvirus 2]QXV67756.1 protein UL2 [Panine betaherpesvirus 2]